MGIRRQEAQYLFDVIKKGVPLGDCLTLGRQNIFTFQWEIADICQDSETILSQDQLRTIFGSNGGKNIFAEELLKTLGARSVQSVDASDYEGATMLHDLNQRFPVSMHEKFDSIIDFGVTEHIFNTPVAFQNVISGLKIGGHYLGALPCNNAPGHGFYQFSPEFFFSLMSPINGMEIVRILLCEISSHAKFKIVPDPRTVKRRVQFSNSRETYIYILAKKVGPNPKLLHLQQSDYLLNWSNEISVESPLEHRRFNAWTRLKQRAMSCLPEFVLFTLSNLRPRRFGDSLAQFENYRLYHS